MKDRHERAQGAPCPICRRPPEGRWRPFCSRRCADVDLGRWLTGSYAIPGDPADEHAPDGRRARNGDGDGED